MGRAYDDMIASLVSSKRSMTKKKKEEEEELSVGALLGWVGVGGQELDECVRV
jgi:hypothetical protein